jgi:hypothetical protein
MDEYAFLSVVEVEHKWPERIPRYLVLVTNIDAICLQIRSRISTAVSMELFSNSPGDFIHA